MKKIVWFAIVAMGLFASPVFATSGACSGHLGVNCSAGADYDGSVICYDGWRNSSVSFLAMRECAQGSGSAPTDAVIPVPLLSTPSIQTETGVLEGSFRASSCPAFSDLENGGSCKCHPGFFAVSNSCVSVQTYCVAHYGSGSDWDYYNQTCACKSGFTLDAKTSQCRSVMEICLERLGPQSMVVMPDQCQCVQSTAVDPTTGKCESIIVLARRQAPVVAPTAPLIVPPIQPTPVAQMAPVETPVIIQSIPISPKVLVPTKKFAMTTRRINVRFLPSANAKVLGTTMTKTSYEILEQKSGWVKIQFGKKMGWIMKGFVSINKN